MNSPREIMDAEARRVFDSVLRCVYRTHHPDLEFALHWSAARGVRILAIESHGDASALKNEEAVVARCLRSIQGIWSLVLAPREGNEPLTGGMLSLPEEDLYE